MPTWDPSLYLRFENQRSRPAADLIARIQLSQPAAILDLGCGPGNSTEKLREKWPQASLTGLDSSSQMLAKARSMHPDWNWIEADIDAWSTDQRFDLVFSNAVLQWVPDHKRTFPRLFQLVAEGGAMAAQMPTNYNSPSHTVMAELAQDSRWNGALAHVRDGIRVENMSYYYEVLLPMASGVDIWETEYLYVLEGADPITEWLRGTGMRPYLDALSSQDQKLQFEDACRKRFGEAYPREADGKTLFPFRRIFIIAYR